MMRWLHRTLGTLTIGPWVVWAACVAGVLVLGLGFGCNIDEGNVHPCVVAGRDVGDFAYTLGFLAAWGVLILGPISLGAGVLWALATLAHRLWRRRVNRRPPSP